MSSPGADTPNEPTIEAIVEQPQDTMLAESTETAETAQPVKRGRGRPKGSKNKKTLDAPPPAPTVPKKRGRPRKERPPEEEGIKPPPKKRGRPSKADKAAAEAAKAEADAAKAVQTKDAATSSAPATNESAEDAGATEGS